MTVNSREMHAGMIDRMNRPTAGRPFADSASRPGSPNRCGTTAVQPIAATRRAKVATPGVMPGISAITITAGPDPSS